MTIQELAGPHMVMSFFKLECLHTCWQLFLTSTLPFFELTIDHYQENTTYQGEASNVAKQGIKLVRHLCWPHRGGCCWFLSALEFSICAKKTKNKIPGCFGGRQSLHVRENFKH